LQADISDRWRWNPDTRRGYTVSGAYHMLTTPTEPTDVGLLDLVWHNQVPLKVSIFGWRLLQDRLPTKNNLVRRGLISVADATCVAGCDNNETMSHLFVHCDNYGALWRHIRLWIGVLGVEPYGLSEHFHQFIHSTGLSRKRRSFLQLVWLLCVWVVWKDRNDRIFNNIHTTLEQLLEKVKYHSLWWLQADNANFVHGTQMWWSNPLLCLGID